MSRDAGKLTDPRRAVTAVSALRGLIDRSLPIRKPAMRIRVLSRTEVESGGAEGADAVISIRSSTNATTPDLAIALAQATRGESARLLRLSFDDIATAKLGHRIGPTMLQITEAIEFGRRVADGRQSSMVPSSGHP